MTRRPFISAVFAFLALPGILAFVVSWFLRPAGIHFRASGLLILAILLILAGWAHGFAAPTLWVYAGIVAIAFHLRVVFGEEPWLARAHPADWPGYRAHVPRWLGLASFRPRRTGRAAVG